MRRRSEQRSQAPITYSGPHAVSRSVSAGWPGVQTTSCGSRGPTDAPPPLDCVEFRALTAVRQWRIEDVVKERPAQTVAEMPSYTSKASKLLTVAERDTVVWTVANEPESGVLIQGTGGIRKIRFGIGSRGKRGGVRVAYFFHNEHMPIYMLAIFAKNEKSDLSASERSALAKLTRSLVQHHRRKQ